MEKGKTETEKGNETRGKRNGTDRVSTIAAVLPRVFELKQRAQATWGNQFGVSVNLIYPRMK